MYLLICKCSLLYIGSSLFCTGGIGPVKTRILGHRSRVVLKVTETPLVAHLTESKHKEDYFKFTVMMAA